jgi:hypothetical protein
MAQKTCKACGAELIPGKEFCPKCLVRIPPNVQTGTIKKQYPKDTPENRAKNLKEYKVIGFEDEESLSNMGKANIGGLEDFLNSHASEGWIVKEVIERNFPSLTSRVHQYVIILERDMPLEP